MCCDSRFMRCELSLMSTYNSSNNCGGGIVGDLVKRGINSWENEYMTES